MCGSFSEILHEFYNFFDNKNNYYFVIGMDNAINIQLWKNYKNTLELISFIIVPRKGYSNNIENNDLWYKKSPHIFIENSYPNIDEISSTYIRNMLNNNYEKNTSQYLYENVKAYIINNNLY